MRKDVFVYCVQKNNNKIGWRIQVSFQIHLSKDDKKLLEKIKATLGGVGKIYDSGKKVLCLLYILLNNYFLQ